MKNYLGANHRRRGTSWLVSWTPDRAVWVPAPTRGLHSVWCWALCYHNDSLHLCVKKGIVRVILGEGGRGGNPTMDQCVKGSTICFIWLFAELVTDHLFTVVAIRHFRVLGSESEVYSVR